MSDDAVSFDEGESLAVDLSNVEGASFEPVPKGKYKCQISDTIFQYSNSSGKPMWSLTLDITTPEYAGRKLFHHISFSENALPFTKTTLSRIAPQLLEGPFNPKDQQSMNHLLGLDVVADVRIQEYQGENRNNVRGLYSASGMDDFMESIG